MDSELLLIAVTTINGYVFAYGGGGGWGGKVNQLGYVAPHL